MQIVVYGHSGSGKTTIVRSYLSRNKIHYITTKCETSTKYIDIIYDGFDKLNAFVTTDKTFSHSKQWTSSLKGEYKGIQAQFFKASNSSQSEKQVRVIPPQLKIDRLAEMMGASGIVWVIEDFHKVAYSEKIHIADMLKVFVRFFVKANHPFECLASENHFRQLKKVPPLTTSEYVSGQLCF